MYPTRSKHFLSIIEQASKKATSGITSLSEGKKQDSYFSSLDPFIFVLSGGYCTIVTHFGHQFTLCDIFSLILPPKENKMGNEFLEPVIPSFLFQSSKWVVNLLILNEQLQAGNNLFKAVTVGLFQTVLVEKHKCPEQNDGCLNDYLKKMRETRSK